MSSKYYTTSEVLFLRELLCVNCYCHSILKKFIGLSDASENVNSDKLSLIESSQEIKVFIEFCPTVFFFFWFSELILSSHQKNGTIFKHKKLKKTFPCSCPYVTPPSSPPSKSLLQSHLRDDDVSQGSRQSEQLQHVLKAQSSVVDDVVLDTVVNIRYFTDVVAAVLHAEVSLEFGPALQHQLQCLTVVQLQVW